MINVEFCLGALRSKDPAALATASGMLGVELTPELAEALLSNLLGMDPGRVVTLLHEAGQALHGIALDFTRDPTHMRSSSYKSCCLVVRQKRKIVVSLTSDFMPKREPKISDFWPELTPWYKDLLKNQAVAHKWASQSKGFRGRRVEFNVAPLQEAAVEPSPLAAVLAAPQKDEPRLAYADWLALRGDPQAEFIRLQCRLAAARPSPANASLEEHQTSIESRRVDNEKLRELEAAFSKRFAGSAATHCQAYEFQRGLVAAVEIKAPTFVSHGAALFADHPIETVSVIASNEAQLKKLAACEALRSVRRLMLRKGDLLKVGSLSSLLTSSQLTNLQELILDWDVEAGELSNLAGDFAALTVRQPIALKLRGSSLAFYEVMEGLAKNDVTKISRLVLGTQFPDAPLESISPRKRAKELELPQRAKAFGQLGRAAAFSEMTHAEASWTTNTDLKDWLSGANAQRLSELDIFSVKEPSASIPLLRELSSLQVLNLALTKAVDVARLLDSPLAKTLHTLRIWAVEDAEPVRELARQVVSRGGALKWLSTHPHFEDEPVG